MKLTITRHGETEENVRRILMGHSPGRLTERGKEQARKLAERLECEDFDIIFSSDLARAKKTCEEIAKFHEETPIHSVEELRERCLGKFEGQAIESISDWESIRFNDSLSEKYNLETISELMQRAKNFIDELIRDSEEKNILIVGHAGINHAIISNLLDQSWTDTFEKQKPKNTSVTIFEFGMEKKPKLILMNCVKHIEEEDGK